MDGTGRGLVDHWSWAAEKGLMKRNTANGLRSACTQVLGVLEGWDDLDIRELDIAETLTRFQNLRKQDFKPQSLEEYKRRFRQAVGSYLSYLGDPGGWKPATRERTSRGGEDGAPNQVIAERPRDRPSSPSPQSVVEYPFPLREDQTIRLILPRDLRTAEVKRLTAFMMTLVIDIEPHE